MENNHIKRCPTSLAIRRLWIKTCETLLLAYKNNLKTVIIPNATKDVKKLDHSWTTLLWTDGKKVNNSVTLENSFLTKPDMKLSYDPATSVLGNYTKNKNLCSHIKNLYTNVHSSFICNGSNWNLPRCPLPGKWLNN